LESELEVRYLPCQRNVDRRQPGIRGDRRVPTVVDHNMEVPRR
jgi:hypothetical protein